MPWRNRRNPYRGFTPSQRTTILRRDPTCRCHGCPRCTPTGCARPSTQADHHRSQAEGGPSTLDNGRGMCTPCHQVKSKAENDRGKRRRYRPTEPHPGRMQ